MGKGYTIVVRIKKRLANLGSRKRFPTKNSISHCVFSNLGIDPLQTALANTGHECKIENVNNSMVFEVSASANCGTVVNNNGRHLLYSYTVQGIGRT